VEAKKILSVAVYNHSSESRSSLAATARLSCRNPTSCFSGQPAAGDAPGANASKILNVPFAIADATALTEAGYVGEMSRTSC